MVENIGDSAKLTLNYINIAVTGSLSSSNYFSGPTGSIEVTYDPVSRSKTRKLEITFSCNGEGFTNGNIHIDSNAVNKAAVDFALKANGVKATMEVADSLAFGDVLVNSPKLQTLNINNKGLAPLKVSGIYLSPGFTLDTPAVAPTPSAPWTVHPVGSSAGPSSYQITLRFTPTSSGPVTGGKLTLTSNSSAGTSKDVSLTGNGLDGVGRLSSSSDIDFNTTAGTPVSQLVQVDNTGSYPLLLMDAGVTISADSPDNPFSLLGYPQGYSLKAARTSPDGGLLTDHANFSVKFAPNYRGTYRGVLVVNTDARQTSALTLPVSGQAQGPEVQILGGDTVYFDSVNLNSSASATMYVTNPGESPLQIRFIQFNRPDGGTLPDGGTYAEEPSTIFGVGRSEDGGPLVLPPVAAHGGTLSIPLIFKPTAEGVRLANAVVLSNARTASTLVRGVGTKPHLTVDPDGGLYFPGVVVGTYSDDKTVNIINDGSGPVRITGVTLPAAGEGIFNLNYSLPASGLVLSTGQQFPITVSFRPTETRTTASVTMYVNVDSTLIGAAAVKLVGGGVLDPVSFESELKFGKQLNGKQAKRILNIINRTSTIFHLDPPAVSTTAGCSQFRVDASRGWPLAIPPGGSKGDDGGTADSTELAVLFTPSSEGGPTPDCVLKLKFTELSSSRDVILSGTGIPKVFSVEPSTTVDFTGVRVGSTKKAQLVIRNLSDDDIILGAEAENVLFGEHFKLNSGTPLDKTKVGVNNAFTLDVEFMPREAKSSQSTISLGTTTPDQPRAVDVTLKGEGKKSILTIDPPSLEFQNIELGMPSETKTVTVTNVSSQLQQVIVGMKHPDNSPFTLNSSGLNSGIPPQASATFTVTFHPTDVGSVEDQVQVRLQDAKAGDDADAELTVKGSGRTLSGRGNGLGCASSAGAGSASVVALLALVCLHARRRRRE